MSHDLLFDMKPSSQFLSYFQVRSLKFGDFMLFTMLLYLKAETKPWKQCFKPSVEVKRSNKTIISCNIQYLIEIDLSNLPPHL